jgi:UDP-2,3-diacylglucosamine pyrophosphatase LpxH
MPFLNIMKALDKAYKKNKKKIELTQETKAVIFSDLHRGVGDYADDFMHNHLVFANALDYYCKGKFIYIELGDGDELYENRKLVNIVRSYGNIFRLMNKFHEDTRLFYVLGNHNLQMGKKKWLDNALKEAQTNVPNLFQDIQIFESLMLGGKIFLVHGHQGDPINDQFASFGRFWVRNVWRPLQAAIGFKDPTSPAENVGKRNKVEEGILEWAQSNKMIVIAGHTHRPMFCSLSKQQQELGEEEKPYYFNCGSGVHPRCITCLEIQNMTLELIKWHIIADTEDKMRLKVKREPIEGCKKSLKDLFNEL